MEEKEIFVLGFNHNKIDLKNRNEVYISDTLKQEIYNKCKIENISDLCIINTCNRTEFYGFGNIEFAKKILFQFSAESEKHQSQLLELSGKKAIAHLFHVASGLDSQIVGDLEILSQFKTAFINAKANGLVSGYFERLVDICLQAAKEIRTDTKLTSGTISHAYAVINLLKNILKTGNEKILVIGTGELGTNVIKNIKSYLPDNQLFIANRTEKSANILATELNCKSIPFSDLANQINNFDVIITALRNLGEPIIKKRNIINFNNKVIVDLSIPFAVEESLKQEKEIIFFGIDKLSKIVNETLAERKKYIPVAEKIILKYVHEFVEWSKIYSKSADIKKWKETVNEISNQCPHFHNISDIEKNSILKKSVANFALFIKNNIDDVANKSLLENYLATKNEDCCQLSNSTKEISKDCYQCLKP